MKKLLLVIPENSYKSNDFVTSAEKLDLDFLVITDSQQVSGQFSDTVIIHSFDEELEDDVKEKLQDVTHILPVDHSALKFSAYLVDLLKAKGNNTKSINTAMNKFESRNIFNSISEIKIQNAIVNKIEEHYGLLEVYELHLEVFLLHHPLISHQNYELLLYLRIDRKPAGYL